MKRTDSKIVAKTSAILTMIRPDIVRETAMLAKRFRRDSMSLTILHLSDLHGCPGELRDEDLKQLFRR